MTKLSLFLPKVCGALLTADTNIVAIVQFGSSVYAPESAIDMDLLVITQKRKDYGVYLDAIADFPFPVDVIPVEIDSKVGRALAAGVKVWARLLYGDADAVERMVKDMPVPSFEEAHQEIEVADTYFQLAVDETDAFHREIHFRTAFNTLFDCARLAAMAFLSSEQTRWGQLRGQLPSPFNKRFRQIIDTLHVERSEIPSIGVDYFYERGLSENIETDYQHWRAIVLQFIKDLEAGATCSPTF